LIELPFYHKLFDLQAFTHCKLLLLLLLLTTKQPRSSLQDIVECREQQKHDILTHPQIYHSWRMS